MSWTDQVRSLVEYNQWANAKVLAACDGLSEEELHKDRGASRGSISELLAHLGQAEAGWFSRLSATEMEPVSDGDAPFADLREMIERVDGKMADWASSVSEGELDTERRFSRPGDATYSAVAWQPLTTLLMHSTQHRAEIGVMLAQVDRSPGDVDFVYFASERGIGFQQVE